MKELSFSSYALIAANLIPLVGVLFYDWNAILVLALFWIENLVIGAFNVVRIILASIFQKDRSGIFSSVFFIVHYGVFCSVHGQILADLLGYPDVATEDYFPSISFEFATLLLDGVAVLYSFIDNLSPAIVYGILALITSHLVSFIENFILRGEIFTSRVSKLMMQPYGQIIVMHIGLIVGAVLLEKLGSPIWLLAVIVCLKIGVDFEQHRRRHKNTVETKEVIKDI